MPFSGPGPFLGAQADTGYQISRSLRFRSSATAYLSRTFGTPTSASKWTKSFWIKRGTLGTVPILAAQTVSASANYAIQFNADNTFTWQFSNTLSLITTQVFRDPSAWYHIVLVWDSANATAANKAIIYVNNVQVTNFSTDNRVSVSATQNAWETAGTGYISYTNGTNSFDGYLAEVNFIDGQALTPSSFGAYDTTTGVWGPARYTGSYGTNGFYIPFTDTTGSVGGNDTYNKVLLHGDGANNSTSIIDSSWSNRKTFTAAGGAKISTTQSKFGGSSIYFDGANNTAVTCPSNADLNPSGDFTIDCWVYFTSSSTAQAVVIKTDSGGVSPYLIYTSGTTLLYYASSNNSSWDIFAGTSLGTFSLNTWTHIAIVRSGNTYYGFVNGVRTTLGTSSLTPTAQTSTFRLGHYTSTLGVMSGYIDEFRFSNGIARWTADFSSSLPTRYTGYIGADTSGNYNDWDAYNISTSSGTTYDSMIDSPTNYADGGNGRGNYATLNPLDVNSTYFVNATFSNANLSISATSTGQYYVHPTISNNTGKFYQEFTVTSLGAGGALTNSIVVSAPGNFGAVYCAYDKSGQKYISGAWTTGWTAWAANDVIGIAVDYDAGSATYYLNGTPQGTLTFGSQGSAPLCVANNAQAGSGGTVSVSFNAGQRPFAFTPPSGYSALNTQNLPTPTIKKGNAHFDAYLYTGDGTTNRNLTGLNFQPDFVWNKTRSTSQNNILNDVLRGPANNLYSDLTNATDGTSFFSAFLSNGVTTGSALQANTNAVTYVNWNWKAGGTGVSNTSGSITSTVSANVSAGFSVVTAQSSGTSGNITVGHGLGVTPSMVIFKNRAIADDWYTYHTSLGSSAYVRLNTTAAVVTGSGLWGAGFTSTTLGLNQSSFFSASNQNFVCYAFAPVAGYSAFGSYTGNGSADGPFVYLGFRPRWIMYKNTSSAGYSWIMLDSSRSSINVASDRLLANTSDSEASGTHLVDFLSNGFKLRNSDANGNASGSTYIYAAFCEAPFQISRAR